MSDNLPRLQQSIPLVDQNGQPSMAFHVWWDKFAKAIESANADLQNQINAINAAQAAADAAQAAADAAQATADSKAKVTRATAAPASPAVNDVWVDTSVSPVVTKTWTGTAWSVAANVGATLGTDVNGTISPSNVSGLVDPLTVGTGYIANNAVTNSVSAYTAGSVTVPGTGVWTDIQTATLNTTGAPLSVQACFYAGLFDVSYATVTTGIFQVQIVRDSTVIYGPVDFSQCEFSGAMAGTGSNSYSLLDQPTAGSHTYKLQAFNNGGTCAPLAISIIVTETKK